MVEAALDGYRAAARKTIAIVGRHLTEAVDRNALEAALEAAYPFWVSGGVARKAWRKEARRFMAERGFRPAVRHELIRAPNGETRREQSLARKARLKRRMQ